jgi:O-antigen/teichoic acid export membrane protein
MLAFFLPLAAAQVLETLRNPLLDAGISRGLEPTVSLAAFGVVGSIVQFLGAAGLVVQSTFLVLVRGRQSYRFMQRYAALYIGFVLILASLAALPSTGEAFFRYAMGTSPELLPDVMTMMRVGLAIPAFNLIRLFFLAQLIHQRQTHVVWLAPATGQTLLVGLAFGLIPNLTVQAGLLGILAWLAVAVVEAGVLFAFARRAQRRNPYRPDPPGERRLDARYATAFAVPLLLTQFSLGASQPLTNAGLLRLPDAETAVAGFRVAFSLAMLTLMGLATLRQTILVMAQEPQDHARGRRFAAAVALALFVLMSLVAFTPANRFVLGTLIGAPSEIVPDAILALQIFAFLPLFMGLRQFYSAITMHQHKTSLVALAAGTRILVLAGLLLLVAPLAGWAGAWVGAAARTSSMASEAFVAYGFGRRFYGQAPRARPEAAAQRAEVSGATG